MKSLGAIIGIYVALRLVMTFMPELIAFFHSFVGLAANLIEFGNFISRDDPQDVIALGLHRLECYHGILTRESHLQDTQESKTHNSSKKRRGYIFGDTNAAGAEAQRKADEKSRLKEEAAKKASYQATENFPDSILWLRKMGFGVWFETEAGLKSKFIDDLYIKAGAQIAKTTYELHNKTEIILKMRPLQQYSTLNVHEDAKRFKNR
ncbi:MAG: hypothetical protein EZS28_032922 [Streblomastix strix]|uniref:proton-translocating NAD(P)(+) transhydrogenase n=1 Tax=Streblomastix strix TaxID=222440 RepID=A0A5J4UND2_9EUKA|nr:MAG: hypothetical protein EZS28_032922 [Streblomastix strix]